MIIINFKETFPSVDVAIGQVEIEIDRYKKIPNTVIKVIHGHGSHGVGGVIRLELRNRLHQLVKQKKIKAFLPGETLTTNKLDAQDFNPTTYNKILLDEDMLRLNPGITFIVVS